MFVVSRQVALLALVTCLAACGGGGSSNGSAAPPAVAANQGPNAAFTLSTNNGPAPLVVTVDAAGSTDSDGVITAYAWDFDGEPGIGRIAQVTFEQTGNFTISLTVTDNDGATTTTSRTVTVSAATMTSAISGTVHIRNSLAVDADVNDRLTVSTSNNDFDDAQPLPSPVTLGGFVNKPGTGETTGNHFALGDAGDFYQINLNGSEVVVLTIAETTADLDLRLWDDQRNIVDASLGVTSTESIQVPQAGNYFIEVLVFSGASNYVLHVGQDVSSNIAARAPSRISDPFIAGELIVKPRANQASVPGKHSLRSLIQQHYEPAVDIRPALFALPEISNKAFTLPATGHADARKVLRMRTLNALKALRKDPDIDYAELNMLAQAHATPDDSFYGSQWHYPAINLPVAWDVSTGSTNVIVGVVDTGVLLNHPDLVDKLTPGYDFVSDISRALDGDGIDANPNDPGDLEYGSSSSFHGTHVAGIIGADSNNNSGVAGVAWQTRIMPLRALAKDGGTTYDIVQAVRYAAGLANDSGTVPAQRADIINLSVGSSFSSQTEQETYNAAVNAGVIIIASAGNESSSLPSYPAAYDGVIAVSATTITNGMADYSNFGNYIDVAAPGGSNATDLNGDGIGDGVISTIGDDGGGSITFGYLSLSGTSMAAPHVAGVAALMKAIDSNLTPEQFNSALLAGDLTDDLGSSGRDDRYGYGLINAQKAVITAQLLANGVGSDPGPILTTSANTLNFGAFLTDLTLNLENVGTGSITINSATASEPWVSIGSPVSPSGGGSGLGKYSITIDRNGLSDGAYQADITFDSDANDVVTTLIMQVSSLDLTADAGLVYVILVDSDGGTVESTFIASDQGEYPYALTNIPAGQYRLFAGTDADDDAKLCDAGETCGAYPTLDAPVDIAVNGDLSDMDFETDFRVNLTNNVTILSADEPAPGISFEKPLGRSPADGSADDNGGSGP